MSNWSKEFPVKQGWYWVRQPDGGWPCGNETFCVLVEDAGSGLVAWVPKMDFANSTDFGDAEWIGPIPVPE